MTDQERIAALEAALAERDAKIAKLEQMQAALQDYVRRLLRGRFGARTEQIIGDATPGQTLIAEVAGAVAPASLPTPAESTPAERPKQKRRGSRRRPSERFPEADVEETVLDVPEAERVEADGSPLPRIGADTTETIEIEGPRIFIKRVIRPRYRAADGSSLQEPAPARIVERGDIGDSLVHRTAIMKFAYATPVHRFATMLAAQGIAIPRDVLTSAFAAWSDLVDPLVKTIRAEVLRARIVFSDESSFKMRDPALHRRCRTTNVWVVSDGEQVVFHWTIDRTHARVHEVLDGLAAEYLVRDEWQGWRLVENEDGRLALVGCNAHARRPFAELQAIDADAKRMIVLYAELAAVEKVARTSGLTGPALWEYRNDLRQRQSRAIMQRIHALAQEIASARTPQSTLGKGAAYILTHFDRLTRFLDDGALPPDNNHSENLLRIVALIRKNSLFLGSPAGGERAANALSVLRSCRMQDVDPATYLAEVTPILLEHRRIRRLGLPTPDLSEWTPRAYAAKRSAAARGSTAA